MQKNRFFVILFLFFIYPLNVNFAQVVNIENKRIYYDTSGWSGAVDASFSSVKTANYLTNIGFRPRVQFKTPKHYYFLMSDILYSKGNNQIFSNQGVIHFRYAYRINSSPWKWESYFQSQFNQLLGTKYRNQLGSGIRFKFYDNKKSKYFIGSSAFFEFEKFLNNQGVNQEFRMNNYLSWYVDPKNNYFFTAATYYQPLFSDFKDFRLMGQYTISFRLTKKVDFKFEWTSFYDSRPLQNITNWTYNTSIGIHIKIED